MVARSLRTRADFLQASGVLLVLREQMVPPAPVRGQPPATPSDPSEGPEILLSVWDDGRVVALHGHVDLGTGVRTAFAQIVAEELGVDVGQVDMLLGDTGTVPNQGPTIASASLQIHAQPLRLAAAQARLHLLARAAEVLGTLEGDELGWHNLVQVAIRRIVIVLIFLHIDLAPHVARSAIAHPAQLLALVDAAPAVDEVQTEVGPRISGVAVGFNRAWIEPVEAT